MFITGDKIIRFSANGSCKYHSIFEMQVFNPLRHLVNGRIFHISGGELVKNVFNAGSESGFFSFR